MKVRFSNGNRSWWEKFPDEDSVSILGGLCVCAWQGDTSLSISCMHFLETPECCTSPLHSRQAAFPRTSLCIVLAKPPSHIPVLLQSRALRDLKAASHPSLPGFPWLLHSWAGVAGRWHCVLTAEMAGGSGDPGCPGAALPGNSGRSTSQPAQASPKPSPTPPARGPPLWRSREQTTPHPK